MAIMGYLRSTSLRGFLVDSFSVSKIGVAALLIFAEFSYALLYIAICLISWIVVPYPRYRAPNKFIKITNTNQFDQLIQRYNKSSIKTVNSNSKTSKIKYQD